VSSTVSLVAFVSAPDASPQGTGWHLPRDLPDEGRVITAVVTGHPVFGRLRLRCQHPIPYRRRSERR
jgi:hypothetical protein